MYYLSHAGGGIGRWYEIKYCSLPFKQFVFTILQKIITVNFEIICLLEKAMTIPVYCAELLCQAHISGPYSSLIIGPCPHANHKVSNLGSFYSLWVLLEVLLLIFCPVLLGTFWLDSFGIFFYF